MNPIIVTYIGFIVAIFILVWGAVELGRRYYRRRKINGHVMNNWIPFEPGSTLPPEDAEVSLGTDDLVEDGKQDIHARAQQNGHYSESKKFL